MQTFKVHKIGENKGAPRIYLEGSSISNSGFEPQKNYEVEVSLEKSMVALRLKSSGDRVVSKKTKGGKDLPVIDINSEKVLSMFKGMDAVRVVMRKNEIFILPIASAVRKKLRIDAAKELMKEGKALVTGGISYGAGILSHAIKSGFNLAGLKSKLGFAVEIRPELLEHAREFNDTWDQDTIEIAAPLQEVAFDDYAMNQLPKASILEFGLPCSGASVAGRAARGTSHAEAHPEVGHLIAAAVSFIAKINPLAIVFENVVPYQSSASMSILRTHLGEMGYVVHETVLEAADWNVLENRKRMCMVAVTEGMEFDFESLNKPEKVERKLSEILEDVPDDDSRWGLMQGLKDKQERDKAAGKNFMMQIVTEESTTVPTITKGYAKIRSTDPKVRNKNNPDLLRQLTPKEHASAKSIDYKLVEGFSNTIAHEALGQSIAYTPFVSVGEAVAKSIIGFFNKVTNETELQLLKVA